MNKNQSNKNCILCCLFAICFVSCIHFSDSLIHGLKKPCLNLFDTPTKLLYRSLVSLC